ncbi:hypothetical protein CcaCcLH18_05254 [Colletotrichum camelliae]|nr:hypothetical protein CcaCcLH18_05254 [Colletotrichum camelliae]
MRSKHILFDDVEKLWVVTPDDQSFESFRKAVSDNCFICSTIWTHDHVFVAPEEWATVWKPLKFQILRHKTFRHPNFWSGMVDAHFMIHLNRLEDSPLPETPLILAGSTASPSSLNQALNWFKKCKTNHEKCRSPPTARSGWLPTRLVDIGIPGEPDWKLRITKDLHKTSPLEYMTLSYRWGPNPEHLLLTDNIDDLQGGWPVKTLPQTFRDFILVTRQFGVRYVWIDRLCIIQDDEKDWKAEAPMMASVYSNSMCNVWASASDSPEGGLFRNRAAKGIAPGIVDTTLTIAPTTHPERCYIYPRRYWDDHLPESPLHCRGWVYQERFFASRVIYFSPQQVMWECLEESGCEGFPKGDVNSYPADHMKGFKTLGSLADLISGPSGFMSSELLGAWEVSVESYSRCQLTRTEDKLYAFSGISKLFQQATGDRISSAFLVMGFRRWAGCLTFWRQPPGWRKGG